MMNPESRPVQSSGRERARTPSPHLNERTPLSKFWAGNPPADIENFADAILHCEGCVRLLCFVADRPQTANTESELSLLLGEPASVVRRALATLVREGAVQQFAVGGKILYQLTHDQEMQSCVSGFLTWRELWIRHAHWLMKCLDADKRPPDDIPTGDSHDRSRPPLACGRSAAPARRDRGRSFAAGRRYPERRRSRPPVRSGTARDIRSCRRGRQ